MFARFEGDRQVLAMEMRVNLPRDMALIVPLPTIPNAGRDALRLLRPGTSALFAQLQSGFSKSDSQNERRERQDDLSDSGVRTRRFVEAAPYDTLYLPSMDDFGLIDNEFQLSSQLVGAFSPYRDYGFAVLKLRAAANARLRSIAFSFPTRDTSHLYFPTFQYRDGTVHNTVMFDVTLYAQNAEKSAWDGTAVEAGDFMSMDDGAEVISVERTVQRRVLYGEKANEDIWLATSS